MSLSLGAHVPYTLPSAPGVWKTTYDELSQQKTYARSPFGPGYAGHLPGTQNSYGHSVPAPDPSRLRGREAIWADEHTLDTNAYENDLRELAKRQTSDAPFYFQVARAARRAQQEQVSSPSGTFRAQPRPSTAGGNTGMEKTIPADFDWDSKMSRCWSAPASGRPFEDSLRPAGPGTRAAPPRKPKDEGEAARFQYVDHSFKATHYQDHKFSYFVPRELGGATKDRLGRANLSKLEKSHKVNLSSTGAGYGYRCEDLCIGNGSITGQGPVGRQDQWLTEHKASFTRPPVLRTGCGPKPQRRALTVPIRPAVGVA
mmetsp:Transcript_28014/g.64656  ORF Transcript_28014/g.64656 Transcript_28014/m.64656 type:complete len:314 (+) Transcript_28014:110-1051(+)